MDLLTGDDVDVTSHTQGEGEKKKDGREISSSISSSSLATSRMVRSGASNVGRRPPPPPPKLDRHGSAPNETSFVSVDGLTPREVQKLFEEADQDKDNYVTDEEARNFFLRSGLHPTQLAYVWNTVKTLAPADADKHFKGLSRRQFSQALRLIALLQSGEALLEEIAWAAVNPVTWRGLGKAPLPPPQFSPQNIELGQGNEQSSNLSDLESQTVTGLEFLGIEENLQTPIQRSSTIDNYQARPEGKLSIIHNFDEQNLVEEAKEHPQSNVFETCRDQTSVSETGNFDESFGPTEKFRTPLAYELRYPPLNFDKSSSLTFLAAGNGSLFAGPSINQGLLQWADPEKDARQPTDPNENQDRPKRLLHRLNSDLYATHSFESGVPSEDRDAAPSHEVKISPRAKTLTSIFVDQTRDIIWVGDKEGWVFGYDISGEPGILVEDKDSLIAIWQAHRVGSITALYVSPNGDLWTGSSRGSIRIWTIKSVSNKEISRKNLLEKYRKYYDRGEENRSMHSLLNHPLAPSIPRELRRSTGERPHNAPVRCITATIDGQLIWTCSSRTVLIWDSITGAYLGRMSRDKKYSSSDKKALEDLGYVSSFSSDRLEFEDGISDDMSVGSFMSPALSATEGYIEKDFKISSSKGLEIDLVTGKVLARPSANEIAQYFNQQEYWASMSDRGVAEFAERISEGAGRAARFMGKIGMKLANIGNTNSNSNPGASTANIGSFSGTQSNSRGQPFLETTSCNKSQSCNDERIAATDEGLRRRDGSYYDESTAPPTPQSARNLSMGSAEPGPAFSGEIINMVPAPVDGNMWVAYRKGRLERYSQYGRMLNVRHFGGHIQTMATGKEFWNNQLAVGSNIWIGFTNGVITILKSDGIALKAFVAHNSGILSIVQIGSRTYTLAVDGSICGWSSAIPSREDDALLRAWHYNLEQRCYIAESVQVLAVTWNCSEARPETRSPYFRWIKQQGFDKSIVVVSLQEVEMGGKSVALAAARDAFNSKLAERGNVNAQFWSKMILQSLGGEKHWHQIGLRQLSGMLIVAFARNNLKGHIGEIATTSVACGVLGVGGNKGAVAIEFSLYRQKIACICSHFAAHQNAIEARNSNYLTIAKQLDFRRRPHFIDFEEFFNIESHAPPWFPHGFFVPVLLRQIPISKKTTDNNTSQEGKEVCLQDSMELKNSSNKVEESNLYVDKDSSNCSDIRQKPSETYDSDEEDLKIDIGSCQHDPNLIIEEGQDAKYKAPSIPVEGLLEAAAVVWMGDLNYRIDGNYDQVKELIIAGEFSPLLACDQLLREMSSGKVFQGMQEGKITFPPTYKFDKGVEHSFAYDSSEKRRVPSWCDRILFRGSRRILNETDKTMQASEMEVYQNSRAPIKVNSFSADVVEENPRGPLKNSVSAYKESFSHGTTQDTQEVKVSLLEYGSWGDVYDSDHKPVYAVLKISMPVSNAAQKRKLAAELLSLYIPEILKQGGQPRASLYPNVLNFINFDLQKQSISIRNEDSNPLEFFVIPEFPSDLISKYPVDIRPMRGWIDSSSQVEVYIRVFQHKRSTVGNLLSKARSSHRAIELPFRVKVIQQYSRGRSDSCALELPFSVSIFHEFYNSHD